MTLKLRRGNSSSADNVHPVNVVHDDLRPRGQHRKDHHHCRSNCPCPLPWMCRACHPPFSTASTQPASVCALRPGNCHSALWWSGRYHVSPSGLRSESVRPPVKRRFANAARLGCWPVSRRWKSSAEDEHVLCHPNCRIIPNAGRLVQNGWLTKTYLLGHDECLSKEVSASYRLTNFIIDDVERCALGWCRGSFRNCPGQNALY